MNRLENSWLALSRSLDSISHGHSAQIVLAHSLGSISRGHSLALLTRRRTISRSHSDLSLLAELTCRSVVTRSTSRHSTDVSSLDLRVVTRPFCRHSTDESSLDRRAVTRPMGRHSTVLSSLDHSVVTRSTSRHSTDESSLNRFVVTRPFCRHSTVLSSLGAECSLASICAVAWLAPSWSLDSLPCGHSTRSIAVTRLAPLRSLVSLPCSHSTCSSRSLDSLSRSYSARITLSQSLRLLASLEHDVIPRRHVHPLSIGTSSMTTCSGGSEHCPHRSFAQPSRSKKSDRNQKYVDDNSPETVRL
ncbi:hypothetical protein DY000_02037731 [Brassica cretica]|uniref:Uncharacterized protein n=1 Tax=Brassica cretica TaxID=69181 RepID=A0ABQ7BAD5_BRACR|nr:hypothetical protein DY000_02037731 [Brassica cretica]